MKKTYSLSKQELWERLIRFHKDHIDSHGPTDLMNSGEYSWLRDELSALLDRLAYPIAQLKYNEEETEWADFWDVTAIQFGEFFRDAPEYEEISLQELLDFKQRLLDELDAMAER